MSQARNIYAGASKSKKMGSNEQEYFSQVYYETYNITLILVDSSLTYENNNGNKKATPSGKTFRLCIMPPNTTFRIQTALHK